MGKLNIQTLLAPISPESPAGEDLSYDAAFLELERISQGTPEQQVGSTIIPAEDPPWRDVLDQSVELLGRTRHLRVVLLATASALQIEGLPGLRDGLAVMRGVLETFWDTFFPRLDPDDNNDPLERMNIVASLAAPVGTFGDSLQIVKRTQLAPLTSSRQLGKLCLRDVMIAKGEMPPPPGDTKPPDTAMIDGAFADTPTEELQKTLQAAEEALATLKAIDSFLDAKVGVDKAPELRAFESTLKDIVKVVSGYAATRASGAPVAAGTDSEGTNGGSGRPAGGSPLTGEIMSTGDVLLALDKICRYYERNELSSPVPFILKAAKRMVSRNFVEIAKIMTPDAIRTVDEMGKEEGAPA